jgi:SAM-dependent methyltransferase
VRSGGNPAGGGEDAPPAPAIRHAYEEHGADAYYRAFGAGYRNPHERRVRAVLAAVVAAHGPDLSDVLDLACGSGEATLALRDLGAGRVEGADPYTGEAYRARTGADALPYSFADVAEGALARHRAGRRYTLAVCSYALHLCPASWLPRVAWELARAAEVLVVVTPHKRPDLRPEWGWEELDEIVADRARARVYLPGG